jgi:hypothetical protein
MPIGAVLSFIGAQEQASATESAANTSANAQLEAARIAAAEARFRPVGITTRYGRSNFQFGIPGVKPPVPTDFTTPEEFEAAQSGYEARLASEGRLTGAGYELSPELRAYQDRILGLTERGLGQAEAGEARLRPNIGAAQSLFNLGSQYLLQTPEQTAQKYMEGQYNLLAPSRERSLAGLRNDQFQKGRLGLSVGATGERPSGGLGLSATNPELEAYYNAIAQQDLQIAQQAEQAGQQRTAFGTGLFSTGNQLLDQYYGGQVNALSPFTSYLGSGQAIEGLGQEPLRLGSELGGKASTAGANAGEFLFRGGSNAATTRQGGQGFSPLAGLFSGASRNPRLQSGFENAYNEFTMNRNIEGAIPPTANPFYSGASPSQMETIMGEYY